MMDVISVLFWLIRIRDHVNMNFFHKTITSITLTLVREYAGQTALINGKSNKTQRFIFWQIKQMPDYLRYPFFILTFCFSLQIFLLHFKPFHSLPFLTRTRVLNIWRNSRLGVRRDFIRFYETLVIFDTSFSEFGYDA